MEDMLKRSTIDQQRVTPLLMLGDWIVQVVDDTRTLIIRSVKTFDSFRAQSFDDRLAVPVSGTKKFARLAWR